MGEEYTTIVGTVGFDGPRARAFATLGCVEYQETYRGVPSPKLLRRLRGEAGPNFQFVVRASCAIAHAAGDPLLKAVHLPYLEGVGLEGAPFSDSPRVAAAWDFTMRAADALGATAILLEAPASFRPTRTNRERVGDFFRRCDRREGQALVFAAGGLWEAEDLVGIAREHDLLPALDPFHDDVPPLPAAYFRVLGRSRQARGLGAGDLEEIADACAEIGTAYVVFDTPRPSEDARRFLRLGE